MAYQRHTMHPATAHYAPNNRILCTENKTTAYFAPNGFHRLAPTVRQSYPLSGRLSAVLKLAPNSRILCTQTFPHTCTQTFDRHAPKIRIHAPKRFRIQTTYCQAKLPTVRQATYCQAGFQPLWNLHPTAAYFAPKRFRTHPNV